MTLRATTSTAIFLTIILFGTVPVAAGACEDMTRLSLPQTTVNSATMVAAGGFRLPTPAGGRGGGAAQQQYAGRAACCRVALPLAPSRDSDIKVEVWLPASGWNGKFQAVGNS